MINDFIQKDQQKTIKKLSDYVWLDNKLELWEKGIINIACHGLHYGGVVFEGVKAKDGKIFKPIEHSKRLLNSANLMGYNHKYDSNEVAAAMQKTIEANNFKDAYIRPIIWLESKDLTLYSDSLRTRFAVIAKHSNPRKIEPFRLKISNWKRISEQSMPAQSKCSALYAMMKMTQQEARLDGYDDALLLDRVGNIAECTTTNIFFVKNNTLFTPIADRFLNGITRQTVIAIAKEMKLFVREIRILPEDIVDFDECFLTGTSAGIRSVKSINYKNEKIEFTKSDLTCIIRDEYQQNLNGTR